MSKIIDTISKFNSLRDSNVKNLSLEEIYKTFGRVLVLCLKNTKLNEDIKNVTNYTIIPMPINIIKNTFIKNFLHILDYEFLNTHFKIDRKYFTNVDQKELVLNFSNMDENTLESYLVQFEGVTKFKDYILATLINDYMAYSNINENVKINRINMLQTINERTYWAIFCNCKLNISLQFMERGFNLNLTERLDNEDIKEIILKINKNVIEDDNYLSYLYRKETYVDAASNLRERGYTLYRITTNELYSTMDIDTFNKFMEENVFMNDKEFYYLVMNLLSSKELCHYIINNPVILNKLIKTDFYSKYYYQFKYFLSYAWLTFYLEESIKKRNITKNDRFIFDINTASLLPETPFNNDDIIKSSAYLPLLVSSQLYNLTDNIMGVGARIREQIRYGIVDFDLFKYRMNLFVSGKSSPSSLQSSTSDKSSPSGLQSSTSDNPNIELFKNLDWSNICISGSIMACCLPNFNPLMLNFMTKVDITTKSDKFLNYINEYYRDADIDMLCNLDGCEFIDKVHLVANTIEKNIRSSFKPEQLELNKDLLIIIKPIKTVAIIINADFIKKYLVSPDLTFGEIVTDINNIKVKKALYPLYISHKHNKNNEFSTNPRNIDIWTNNIYAPEFDIISVEQLHIVFARTKKDKNDDIKKYNQANSNNLESVNKSNEIDENDEVDDFKPNDTNNFEKRSLIDESNILFIINENLKFKISSPYMQHSIELFKIRFNDFFATVSTFHLPIVRSYYDGNTVKMTPSCISACMTMINMDYKYFAGSKDPIEIINKYRCRGYGTILNDKEKIRFFEYNNLIEKWKNIYSIKLNDSLSIKKCLGFKLINDPMFEFSKKVYNENTNYNDILPEITITTDKLVENIYSLKLNHFTSLIKNLRCVNDYGYIEPMQHFIIDMGYFTVDKK